VARQRRLLAVVFMAAVLFPFVARSQGDAGSVRLVDVPYLPQSEALCGGAAAAMVMRFFGAADVYADSFASLLEPDAAGIRTSDLVDALRARGWETSALRGDSALVRASLAARRPVVVLIDAGSGRFHYVVVVGWSSGRVILHDPARGPFRVLDEGSFERAWSRSSFWTMLLVPKALPETKALEAAPSRSVQPPERDSCDAMVAEGIKLSDHDPGETRRLFALATEMCPQNPSGWRELAGLAALEQDWRTAARLAREALRRDPGDRHASRILATSLFLVGKADEALGAWNSLEEPVIDLVDVKGLERTRYSVVASALRLEPRTMLTREAIAAARRRLAELPTAVLTQVSYKPGETGRATIEAAVVERPLAPWGTLPLGVLAAHVATDREVTVAISSPTGGGEVVTGSWRWWEERPRLAFTFTAPSPSRRVGNVWRLEAFDERQTYGALGAVIEKRRSVAFSVTDWTSGRQRWEAIVGADRWNGIGASLRLGAGLEQRLFADRVRLAMRGEIWTGDVRTATVSLGGNWRSAVRNEGNVFAVRAGIDAAGDSAPLALWPGAGTGQGRDALLRAHPLLDDGIIRGGVFGRRLIHGGGEWRRWIQPGARPWRVAPALFVDVGRASRGMPDSDTRGQVDAGAGLRLGLPGASVFRIDIARGLRDGATALSVGWTK
jgi:Peptidase C39 family